MRFYDRAFSLLGFEGERYDSDLGHEWDDFSISPADAEHPPTHGLHAGFAARSREQVDEWWAAMREHGAPDDGPPGPRPEYGPDYYGAFVRDPDGNSVEAVRHGTTRDDGWLIDHLWIRVATSPRRPPSIVRSRLRRAARERARPTASSSSPAARRSRSSRGRRPSTCTSRSASPTRSPSRRSTRPACGGRPRQRRAGRAPRSTTPATTAPSCSTPTATTSRPSSTTVSSGRARPGARR